ncbi:MAG TPA: hypothetical protein VH025_07705 [Solirubrobacteraceae bacterium]|nr:hypothetical protein [Solirubrobacteraceae bacterium]
MAGVSGKTFRVSATLQDVLAAQLRRGERLLREAGIVGDTEGHQLWQLKRLSWSVETVSLLADAGAALGTVHTFEHAVAPPASETGYFEALPLEVECVREGIEVLERLKGE